ncbi:MAG: Pectinesterase, partial [Segetibacter sp.]|nr:Pectinesterase [Segetibacter sp.]
KTVQQAINAAPDSANTETVIYIKSGIYKEKLFLPKTKLKLHFIGENVATTKLTFDNYASKKDSSGKELGTARTASFYIYGSDFIAENITFENSSGPVGQALAVWVGSDRSRFFNCRFLGFQDTIYTDYNARQYYKNCYIEGTTDFIFGPATAVFDNCEIYCKKGGSYITAASTPDSVKYGYVFLNCRITGDTPPASFDLGRPWRPFAKVVYINCKLGNHIKPGGWNNWRKESNEKTAYFAEYQNKGEGAKPMERVSWSHQLTGEEAKQYTLANIFNGWKPLARKTK